MKTRSRRYKNSLEHTDRNTDHDLENAISILSKQSVAKFDESVEISFSLGVDPKQSSQTVRGTVNLPHGSGKDIKDLVLTENAEEATKLGADFAGLGELISKIKAWLENGGVIVEFINRIYHSPKNKWLNINKYSNSQLPTVMKKVIEVMI